METIGWIGSILLTLCVIPQMVITHKTKNTEGLSWAFLVMWGVGLGFSNLYAIELMSLPLVTSFTVNLIAVSYMTWIKFKNS